jgi:hypothetical protein
VLIGLAKLSPILSLSMSANPKAGSTGRHQIKQTKGGTVTRKDIADPSPVDLAFSDTEPSDESSNSDED